MSPWNRSIQSNGDVSKATPADRQVLRYNVLTRMWELANGANIVLSETEPINPGPGDQWINTLTNELRIYYCGYWQTVAVLQGLLSYLTLETGDILLFENSDLALLEFSIGIQTDACLLEESDILLLEATDGSMLLLEA